MESRAGLVAAEVALESLKHLVALEPLGKAMRAEEIPTSKPLRTLLVAEAVQEVLVFLRLPQRRQVPAERASHPLLQAKECFMQAGEAADTTWRTPAIKRRGRVVVVMALGIAQQSHIQPLQERQILEAVEVERQQLLVMVRQAALAWSSSATPQTCAHRQQRLATQS